MAGVDFAGAAVGTLFGEVFTLVKYMAKKNTEFKPLLERIEAILTSLEPRIHEIERSDRVLNRPPEEIIKFIRRLEDGKNLIQKCKRISSINIVKRTKYSNRLAEFENSLVRFFQIDVQALILRDCKDILESQISADQKLETTNSKIDQLLSTPNDSRRRPQPREVGNSSGSASGQWSRSVMSPHIKPEDLKFVSRCMKQVSNIPTMEKQFLKKITRKSKMFSNILDIVVTVTDYI